MPWPLWLPWIVNNSLNISLDLAIWKDIKKKQNVLQAPETGTEPNCTKYCETSILAPSARNMNERCNLLQLNAFFAEGKTHIYHGPKIGATNLEAELLILILWPHFGVQNLAPVLGPQNTNRSQYGQQVCYCRRKLTAAHVRDTPRAQPWAHLGFEKKRPQCLNKRPTKAWGTNMYESQWLGRETTKHIAKNY